VKFLVVSCKWWMARSCVDIKDSIWL
jgi:hypothetical protein